MEAQGKVNCWLGSAPHGGSSLAERRSDEDTRKGKLQFLIKKNKQIFSAVRNFFFNFWSLKPWIRIGVHPKMLDPDPDEMNKDPPTLLWRLLDEKTGYRQKSFVTKGK